MLQSGPFVELLLLIYYNIIVVESEENPYKSTEPTFKEYS